MNRRHQRSVESRVRRNTLSLQAFDAAAAAAGLGETATTWLIGHAPYGALNELARLLDPECTIPHRPMRPRRSRFSKRGTSQEKKS